MLEPLSITDDQAFTLRQLLAEAEAIQEMATRISGDNAEDFDMLQNANRVTFRLLMEARELVGPKK
ncbi:hypothetical protein N790_13225 [Arenimonas malthae CC-JY-1]|uniref:Uncharacterized protein n=2 Tax=Arenimonas TaxID=490567 RepID=A0A091BKG1_9GAMM|nr:hypothetical protein N790_13225 [Arenimonas malthae CC-JY-1]